MVLWYLKLVILINFPRSDLFLFSLIVAERLPTLIKMIAL